MANVPQAGPKQAQRLWAIDADTYEVILGSLEASHFLRHNRDGDYMLDRTIV